MGSQFAVARAKQTTNDAGQEPVLAFLEKEAVRALADRSQRVSVPAFLAIRRLGPCRQTGKSPNEHPPEFRVRFADVGFSVARKERDSVDEQLECARGLPYKTINEDDKGRPQTVKLNEGP